MILIQKDSTEIPIEITTHASIFNQNPVIIGIIKDISLQLRQEAELTNLERRYGSVTQSAAEGIISSSSKGKIIAWNRGAENIFGYLEQEMLGRPLITIIPRDSRNKHRNEFENAIQFGTKRSQEKPIETAGLRKDGTVIPIELSISKWDSENEKFFTSIIRDISDRKDAEEKLRAKSEQQEKLLITAQNLNASLEVREVLDRIAKQATTLLDCFGVSLYTLDETGKILKPVLAIEPPYEEEILSAELDVENSLSGQVVKQKRGMIFNNALNTPGAFQVPGTPEDKDEHVLVSPFLVDGEVIGTLIVNRFKHEFSSEDLALADTIAAYAATALKNAQVYKRLQNEVYEREQAEKVQKALFKISESANKAENLDSLYRSIHKIINELIYAKNLFFALHDPATDIMYFPYHVDQYDPCPKPRKLDNTITAKVIKYGKPNLKSFAEYSTLLKGSKTKLHGTRSLDWLGVPLKSGKNTIGALVVQTYSKGERYSEKDLELLTYVSSQVGLAIDRKQAEEKFQESVQEILILEEINRDMQQGKPINDIINELSLIFSEISPVNSISFYLYEEDKKRLYPQNPESDNWMGEVLKKMTGDHVSEFTPIVLKGNRFEQVLSTGEGFMTGDPKIIADLFAGYTTSQIQKKFINSYFRQSPIKTIGVIPLISDEAPLGLITFDSTVEMSISDFDRVKRIANQIANVLQRAKSQDQLRNLSAAVEQSPASVVITDPEGIVKYVNPKFVELTGYSRAEIIGKTPRIHKSGVHNEKFYANLWNTIKSGKEWHGEFCNKTKNGDLFWEMASISPIVDDQGSITHFIAVKEDITHRKNIDAAIKESEEKFRTLFEESQDAIYISDGQGKLQN
ncbi:MAG: PAS domain S-box protein, partial [Candidatus Neomarinimicrobiota bacterium]